MITGATDYSGSVHRDLVIEAVFEDLAFKQQMVADVEQHCAPHTIFASNTSSLPIGDIAAKSRAPGDRPLMGPVEKLACENAAGGGYIPHATTSLQPLPPCGWRSWRKTGQTLIVVADKAGFYVNRILAPYIVTKRCGC